MTDNAGGGRFRMAVLASEAVLAGLIAVPRAGTVAALSGAVATIIVRPELVVLAFFLLIEELPASSPFLAAAPRALIVGTQAFQARPGGLALPLAVIAAGATILLLRSTGSKSQGLRWDRPAVWLLVALAGWSATLSMLQEDQFSPLGVAARAASAAGPWLAALAAYCFGSVIALERRKLLMTVVAGALVAKAALAVVLEVTTGGVRVDAQRHVIFYDAALPTLAAAVLIGQLLVDRRASVLGRLISISAAVVVLVSFRRAVWLMVAIAFAVVPLVRRRAAVARRVAMVCAVGVALLFVVPPSVRAPVAGRVLEAIGAVQGRTADRNSSQLHVDDITAAVDLASRNALEGIGVRSLQPAGFAVPPGPDQYLYVHNEPLQTWLRLGLPGLVLFIGFLGHVGWRGVRLLSRGERLDEADAAAAVLVTTIAVPVMTAAFLSTTWRFPVLLGMAAAVVDCALEREPDQAATGSHPGSAPMAAGLPT